MKQCPKCGAIDLESDTHCGVCGASLKIAVSETRDEIVPEGGPYSALRRMVVLSWLLTCIAIIVPLYFGTVALAVWGPFSILFNAEVRVFVAGIVILMGGLSLSVNLLGEKEDPTRTAHAVRDARIGTRVFPRADPGERQSDLRAGERSYASALVEVLGLSMVVTGSC